MAYQRVDYSARGNVLVSSPLTERRGEREREKEAGWEKVRERRGWQRAVGYKSERERKRW